MAFFLFHFPLFFLSFSLFSQCMLSVHLTLNEEYLLRRLFFYLFVRGLGVVLMGMGIGCGSGVGRERVGFNGVNS